MTSLKYTSHCNTLPHTATQSLCAATHCNTLQQRTFRVKVFAKDIATLQCLAVCCSVLQCVALYRSVLQCVAVCCSVLQRVAACCSVLQRVAVCCSLSCRAKVVAEDITVLLAHLLHLPGGVLVRCSVLQCVARYRSVLQRVAACCSVLQRVAACCSVLQRVAQCVLRSKSSRRRHFHIAHTSVAPSGLCCSLSKQSL